MDMVVIMVLIASCFFSVAVNEYSNAVGEGWVSDVVYRGVLVGRGCFRGLAEPIGLLMQAYDGRSSRKRKTIFLHNTAGS